MSKTPEQTIAELTDQLQRAQAHNQRLVEENEALHAQLESQGTLTINTNLGPLHIIADPSVPPGEIRIGDFTIRNIGIPEQDQP